VGFESDSSRHAPLLRAVSKTRARCRCEAHGPTLTASRSAERVSIGSAPSTQLDLRDPNWSTDWKRPGEVRCMTRTHYRGASVRTGLTDRLLAGRTPSRGRASPAAVHNRSSISSGFPAEATAIEQLRNREGQGGSRRGELRRREPALGRREWLCCPPPFAVLVALVRSVHDRLCGSFASLNFVL